MIRYCCAWSAEGTLTQNDCGGAQRRTAAARRACGDAEQRKLRWVQGLSQQLWRGAASYGDRAPCITRLAEQRKLGRRLVRGHPMIEAEVVWAVREELCQTACDFIARRTRLAFVDVAACEQALPRVREARGVAPGCCSRLPALLTWTVAAGRHCACALAPAAALCCNVLLRAMSLSRVHAAAQAGAAMAAHLCQLTKLATESY